MYIYAYIYVHICTYIHMCIHMYIFLFLSFPKVTALKSFDVVNRVAN